MELQTASMLHVYFQNTSLFQVTMFAYYTYAYNHITGTFSVNNQNSTSLAVLSKIHVWNVIEYCWKCGCDTLTGLQIPRVFYADAATVART